MHPSPESPAPASPWHPGEIALQRQVGVAAQLARVGHAIFRPFMMEPQRAFYARLPFIVIGAVDPDGLPWATIRAGRPGFLGSPAPSMLTVAARRDAGDPAEPGMEEGAAVGLLGIDLATRRRLRLNGRVERDGDDAFRVDLDQSFGNCPSYITPRDVGFARDPALPFDAPTSVSATLGDAARALIAAADTFFVASYVDRPEQGRQVDASHRGGPPGFVHCDADGVLTVPDYAGNQFFNTLGNFLINPRAGLLFVDPASGDTLQLSGKVELILDGPLIAAFDGAERLWRVVPELVVLRTAALPMRWTD